MPRALLTLALVLAGCSAADTITAPFAIDAPLPSTTPEAVGLDTTFLNNVSRQIAQGGDHELHSMLVVRDGRVAFEEYSNGYTRDTPHDLRSTTKSITSLLTGIAIEEGALVGVEAPLMNYLGGAYPEVRDKDDLLLRHLLTMSSGLDCHDSDRSTRGQEDRMYRSDDWVAYFLSLDRVHAPGDSTRYCTGGVVALGAAIAQGTGQDVAAFADRVLFAPLGIHNYRWARFDDGRQVDTGGHLLLTPQGLAKLGILVLQNGRWEGEQLVPAAWLERSTRPITRIGGTDYGYLWWRSPIRYGEKVVDVLYARGNGGQALFIVPEYDLVAVFTAGYYNSERSQDIYALFRHAVLPSVTELAPYLPRTP